MFVFPLHSPVFFFALVVFLVFPLSLHVVCGFCSVPSFHFPFLCFLQQPSLASTFKSSLPLISLDWLLTVDRFFFHREGTCTPVKLTFIYHSKR